MKRLILIITSAFIFLIFSPSRIMAQISFADSCFTSGPTGTTFPNTPDLTNNNADLMSWDPVSGTWIGSWSGAALYTPAPDSLGGCRAIFIGNGVTWTSGGEGFGMRINSPLVSGQTYSFTLTYVSDGFGSTGSFSPKVYSSSSTAVPSGTFIGYLAPAGYTWLTSTFTFTAQPSQNGDTWIILSTDPDGTSGMISSMCPQCQTSSCNLAVNLGPDTTLCSGQQLTLNAASAGASYMWQDGSTNPTFNATTPGTYWVHVTRNACAAADTIVITGASAPVVNLGNDTTVCGGQTVVLNAGNPGSSYLWNNNAVGQTINATSAGTYSVKVTNVSGCTASDTIVVSQNIIVLNLSTSGSVCTGPGVITASVTSGTGPFTYAWDNGPVTPGDSNLTTGVYAVTVTGNLGCKAIDSASINASIAISLATAAFGSCSGSNGTASVAVTIGSGPFTYGWSNSGTTDTITNLVPGVYYVTVSNNGGCMAIDSATVDSTSLPNITINANQSVFCSGDSAQICAPTGYTSYAWNNGDNTTCITVLNAGNYYVTVSNSQGCTAVSNHLPITVNPAPPVSISVNGDTLTSYNASSYQWYLNDTLITGATSHTWIATQSGYYSVEVTGNNGCSVRSTETYISLLGINEPGSSPSLQVYPNPTADGTWRLTTGTEMLGSAIEIYDDNGRIVYRGELRSEQAQITLNVACGIYFMRVFNGQSSTTVKLVRY